MSGEDKILDQLFEQARNETTETTINDIQKWIGLVTIGTVIIGWLAKMKLMFTKSVIMYTSVILAVGIGTGAYFLSGTESTQKIKKFPVDSRAKANKEIRLENETPFPSIVPTKRINDNREQPVLESLTENMPTIPFELPIRRFFPEGTPQQFPINTQTNEENYGSFNTMKIMGMVNVVLEQGTTENVRIEGDERGKEILVIKNKNGTLEIYTETKKPVSDFDVTVYVTVTMLTKIESAGATDLSSKGTLKFDNFELKSSGASDVDMNLNINELVLNISGASDIDLEIDAKKIDADISGASDVMLSGKTSYLDLLCSGASDLKAERLSVQEGEINCSGASVTKLYITDKMNLTVSGASDVKYKGNPTIGTKSVTGASKVRQF